MADRNNYYVGQLLTEAELDGGFDQLEIADRRLMSDTGLTGIFEGFGVVQRAGGANLSVDVSAGLAYGPNGERERAAVMTNVNVAVDKFAVTTSVVTPGNSRIISVVIIPDRVNSDPRTDATNTTIYFLRSESYKIEVIQGSEAVFPTAPAIPAGAVLLADITRAQGQTTIVNANITVTGRRQDTFVIAGSPHTVRRGKLIDVLTDYLSWINAPPASSVTYAGSGFFADGATTIAAGSMESAVDSLVSKVASTTTSSSGSRLIGVEQDTSSPSTLPAGTLRDRLVAQRLAVNIAYAGSGAWADATSIPATSVEAAIDTLVSTIAATTFPAKAGLATRTIWLGGRTNPATTLQAGIDKIITDLAVQVTADDGMKRIGGQAVSGTLTSLAAGSARSQVDELLTAVNARIPTYTKNAVTLAPSGGTTNVTVADIYYVVNAISGGNLVLSAPTAALGPKPTITFVTSIVSGDNLYIKHGSTTVLRFTGMVTSVLDAKTWGSVYWNGTTWVAVRWGAQVEALVF